MQNLKEYFDYVERSFNECKAIHSIHVFKEAKTETRGLIKIRAYFVDGSEFYLMEFVEVKAGVVGRYKYRYQYQKDNETIFRYDNAPHYPELNTFPHHKHKGKREEAEPAEEPDFGSLLEEITEILSGLLK